MLLQSAHERKGDEGLSAVLAFHACDARQVDDAETSTDLAGHISVEHEVWTVARARAFCGQPVLEHDRQPEVLVNDEDDCPQQLRECLLVCEFLHAIDEFVEAKARFR